LAYWPANVRALLGMYGWPPGYNKANSAELSRQLVP